MTKAEMNEWLERLRGTALGSEREREGQTEYYPFCVFLGGKNRDAVFRMCLKRLAEKMGEKQFSAISISCGEDVKRETDQAVQELRKRMEQGELGRIRQYMLAVFVFPGDSAADDTGTMLRKVRRQLQDNGLTECRMTVVYAFLEEGEGERKKDALEGMIKEGGFPVYLLGYDWLRLGEKEKFEKAVRKAVRHIRLLASGSCAAAENGEAVALGYWKLDAAAGMIAEYTLQYLKCQRGKEAGDRESAENYRERTKEALEEALRSRPWNQKEQRERIIRNSPVCCDRLGKEKTGCILGFWQKGEQASYRETLEALYGREDLFSVLKKENPQIIGEKEENIKRLALAVQSGSLYSAETEMPKVLEAVKAELQSKIEIEESGIIERSYLLSGKKVEGLLESLWKRLFREAAADALQEQAAWINELERYWEDGKGKEILEKRKEKIEEAERVLSLIRQEDIRLETGLNMEELVKKEKTNFWRPKWQEDLFAGMLTEDICGNIRQIYGRLLERTSETGWELLYNFIRSIDDTIRLRGAREAYELPASDRGEGRRYFCISSGLMEEKNMTQERKAALQPILQQAKLLWRDSRLSEAWLLEERVIQDISVLFENGEG